MSVACVLTFHGLPERAARDHDVAWSAFLALLDRIAAAGATVVPSLEPPAAPGVVLTFDDATADHARAGRELAERGLRGIFFVPTGLIGAPGRLGEDELRRLHALGHVIGAHAHHHAPLAGVPRDAVALELQRSRDVLRALLGTEIRYFAPPGGVGNPFLAGELERHGFTASRSMRWGLYRSPEERWSIPCVPVTQLTLRRGWVAAALERHELPVAMRSAWLVKRSLPPRLRSPLRRAAHAHVRGAS